MSDVVNHPPHYTSGPTHSACGEVIECIDVVRDKGFSIGNAIKYVWRTGLKGDSVEDLKKAVWYLQDEITRLEKDTTRPEPELRVGSNVRINKQDAYGEPQYHYLRVGSTATVTALGIGGGNPTLRGQHEDDDDLDDRAVQYVPRECFTVLS